MADIYHVWRRSDGYVNASATSQPGWSKFYLSKTEPVGLHGTIDGAPATFKHLLTTTDWPKARKCILRERGVEEEDYNG